MTSDMKPPSPSDRSRNGMLLSRPGKQRRPPEYGGRANGAILCAARTNVKCSRAAICSAGLLRPPRRAILGQIEQTAATLARRDAAHQQRAEDVRRNLVMAAAAD